MPCEDVAPTIPAEPVALHPANDTVASTLADTPAPDDVKEPSPPQVAPPALVEAAPSTEKKRDPYEGVKKVLQGNKERQEACGSALRQALLALGPPGQIPQETLMRELAHLHAQVHDNEMKLKRKTTKEYDPAPVLEPKKPPTLPALTMNPVPEKPDAEKVRSPEPTQMLPPAAPPKTCSEPAPVPAQCESAADATPTACPEPAPVPAATDPVTAAS